MSVTGNIKPLCFLSDILDRTVMHGDEFVVSALGESLVYANDGYNNSDRVRSHYAKTSGQKFTSVRCCRLKNFKG